MAHETEDREWTHDPLERSFFGTVARGYLVGMVIFGLFGFTVARVTASEWGVGAAIGIGLFVAVFAGILGGVVLIGIWSMKNEELIRGNETGHAPASEQAFLESRPPDPSLAEQADSPAADPADPADAAAADPVAVPLAGPDEGSVNQG